MADNQLKNQIPPRGIEPLEGKHYHLDNKGLTENTNSVLSTSLDILLQKDADLKQIISAWPNLSEDIKAVVKALIRTHINQTE